MVLGFGGVLTGFLSLPIWSLFDEYLHAVIRLSGQILQYLDKVTLDQSTKVVIKINGLQSFQI